MRAVLVLCSKTTLARMLHVPKEVVLDRVVEELDKPDELILKLTGDGLPEMFEV